MLDMINNSRFAQALEAMKAEKLPDNAFKHVGQNPDGSDMMVVAASFKFSVEKGKRSEVEISNPDVAKILYEMQGATQATNEIDKFIARKLYQLSTYDEVIKRMNFDSGIDLACTVFGMSKDWASKRLRIGKYFINDNYEFVPVIPASWTVSHVQEVLQYLPKLDDGKTVDDAKVIPFMAGLINEGIIADGMTCKKLRESLTEKFPGAKVASKRALKAGEKKEGEKKANATEGEIDISEIDRLSEMSNDAKVGVILNALKTIETVFPTLDNNGRSDKDVEAMKSDVMESIEFLRGMARLFVK